jgi:hypothetical protein
MWDMCVMCMGEKSETRPTYARLQLHQIEDMPAFVIKGRRVFLDARL